MADPTSVRGKVPDAPTQTNAHVLGAAPAQSLAMVYQTMAHSVALSMQNAVAAQQEMRTLSQAIIAQAVQSFMRIDPGATARTTPPAPLDNEVFRQLADLLSARASAQSARPRSDRP